MPHHIRYRSDRRRILLMVAIANLVLALGVALVLYTSWERNRAGIQQILQSEAAFWSDAMNQRFDQVQSTCDMAGQQLQRDPGLLLQPEPWLDDMVKLMPFIDGAALVAPNGALLAADPKPGRKLPPRADFTSRPSFQLALKSPGKVQIGLSQPDPFDPTQTTTPARCALRVPPTDKTVVLVFNLGLQRALSDLQHTLSAFDGRDRWVPAIGLLRGDGYLLARLPAPLPHTRNDLARAPARGVLAREIAANPSRTHGFFQGPVQSAGGVETMGAWQRLGDHSVVAFTSLPVSALTGLWWRQSWPTLLTWGLLLVLQLVGGVFISRAVERQHRLAEINAALAQANQVVAEAPD